MSPWSFPVGLFNMKVPSELAAGGFAEERVLPPLRGSNPNRCAPKRIPHHPRVFALDGINLPGGISPSLRVIVCQRRQLVARRRVRSALRSAGACTSLTHAAARRAAADRPNLSQ